MCGICGIIDFKRQLPNKIDLTKLMSEKLFHRGPDDSGDYNDNPIALGFTRLSILDVQNGNQPMFNKTKVLYQYLTVKFIILKKLNKNLF